jgi:hypothetical protein
MDICPYCNSPLQYESPITNEEEYCEGYWICLNPLCGKTIVDETGNQDLYENLTEDWGEKVRRRIINAKGDIDKIEDLIINNMHLQSMIYTAFLNIAPKENNIIDGVKINYEDLEVIRFHTIHTEHDGFIIVFTAKTKEIKNPCNFIYHIFRYCYRQFETDEGLGGYEYTIRLAKDWDKSKKMKWMKDHMGE